MKGAKFVLAQTAAQAVALAVREANGEVVLYRLTHPGEELPAPHL